MKDIVGLDVIVIVDTKRGPVLLQAFDIRKAKT